MKQIILILGMSAGLLTVGCAPKVTQQDFDEMESDYQQQISALQEKVESQQEYIKQTNESIQDISNDVDRFEYENWRNVVPDVYHKVKELDSNSELAPADDSVY